MIVTIDSFEKYRAFIQDISRDPFFCDPHFTYDPDNLYGSLHRKDESAFAVVTDGTVQGLFVWLILPDRRYMEMLIGLTRSEAAFSEMLSHLAESYPGYQADFVLNPKNTALFRVLTGKGAYFDREQQKMLLTGPAPAVSTSHTRKSGRPSTARCIARTPTGRRSASFRRRSGSGFSSPWRTGSFWDTWTLHTAAI